MYKYNLLLNSNITNGTLHFPFSEILVKRESLNGKFSVYMVKRFITFLSFYKLPAHAYHIFESI